MKLLPPRRRLAASLSGVLLVIPLLVATASHATPASATPLTLQNGWTNAPFSTRDASVSLAAGIVTLSGAIATSGTNPSPFTLPAAFRPTDNVYVRIDLCDSVNGSLFIAPSGVATLGVEQGFPFSEAQCFTSLDGVSFGKTSSGFTPLSLQNGWGSTVFTSRTEGARNISGVVYLEGAIRTEGTNPVAFTLPASMRPSATVFVPIYACSTTAGAVEVQHSGVATILRSGGTSVTGCTISLEGASFATATSGYKALVLKNGWRSAGSSFGTRTSAVKKVGNVVRFVGAMKSSGSDPVAFTLPAALRPSAEVFVPADLCNGTNGRLIISHNGTVTVEAEGPNSDATCFTSLDGVEYFL